VAVCTGESGIEVETTNRQVTHARKKKGAGRFPVRRLCFSTSAADQQL